MARSNQWREGCRDLPEGSEQSRMFLKPCPSLRAANFIKEIPCFAARLTHNLGSS